MIRAETPRDLGRDGRVRFLLDRRRYHAHDARWPARVHAVALSRLAPMVPIWLLREARPQPRVLDSTWTLPPLWNFPTLPAPGSQWTFAAPWIFPPRGSSRPGLVVGIPRPVELPALDSQSTLPDPDSTWTFPAPWNFLTRTRSRHSPPRINSGYSPPCGTSRLGFEVDAVPGLVVRTPRPGSNVESRLSEFKDDTPNLQGRSQYSGSSFLTRIRSRCSPPRTRRPHSLVGS